MIKNKKIICLIVAKKKSTGLKNKNILPLAGKPLIHWTFSAAKKSKFIDQIILSTDSKLIIKIAKKQKIHVPFVRPKKLANVNSSIYDVISHAKKSYSSFKKYDYLILLQPTTPFRSSQHLDAALKKFVSSRPKSQTTLVSVTKIPKKAHWLLKKINKNYIRLLNNKITKYVNRQDVEDLYIPNGAIYICKIKNFKNNFYTKKIMFFLMDDISSIDIDSKKDFESAKTKAKKLLK